MNSANQDATADAIKELFENAHFLDRTKENAAVVEGASVLILNALIGDRFVPTLKLLLSRYDQNYDLIRDWNAAFTNFVWQVLNRCARVQGCRSAEHNSDLAIRLGDYIHGNIAWLNRADHDHHLHNLGYQLGNFYSGSGDAQFSTVKAELDAQMNKILNAFGPLPGDVGRNAYLAVLSAINFHGQCAAFGLCDKKQELIDKVLDDRITCPSGTLFMWAQDMNQAQLEWACTSLVAHENHFHTTMQTNRTPVTPDDNDKLRMVVFNDSSEWRAYGYLLFGASTDNGGLYLEGDPSQPGDQATFFAYEDVGCAAHI